ncbi:MAG: rhomboid family intramembrane serine protease [Deltaproteobacteria bacterium]
MRTIILLTLGIWITVVLLLAFDRPDGARLLAIGELFPGAVLHGAVWQLLTYGFVHVDPWHVIFTLIAVYFIGSAVQERVGSRSFAELYVSASVLAGIGGVLLALTGRVGFGTALGAGAAANGVLMVFYLLYRGSSIFLFPLPFQIPVKWVVIVIGGIEAAYFLLNGFPLFFLVQLLGLGAGYVWYRFLWRRAGVSTKVQDRVTGLRNRYYRWKRRRAARKFEVYMRKHEHDPKQYFDEYGNFKPPSEKDKSDRGPGGWVN